MRARRTTPAPAEPAASGTSLGSDLMDPEPHGSTFNKREAHFTTGIATSGGNDRLAAVAVHPPSTLAIGVRNI